jgi:tRNA nucleotidyltransferase/poly(A) polymerase
MNAAQELFQNVQLPTGVRVFAVGGCVRDELAGLAFNDVDLAVDGCRDFAHLVQLVEAWGFEKFNQGKGRFGFVEHAHVFSLKAKAPAWSSIAGEIVDFVCCRRESAAHSDGRRPDQVEIGNLKTDLDRRDFTFNALAQCVKSGELVDLHCGADDLAAGRLRAVGNAKERLLENPVRVVRVLRFWVVKGFSPDAELLAALADPEVVAAVAAEDGNLVREQLNKVFAADASVLPALFAALARFPDLSVALFSNGVNLVASQAKR